MHFNAGHRPEDCDDRCPKRPEISSTLVIFISDKHEYGFYYADERPDYELDPTVNLYRDDEEEPIATIHLNPQAACVDTTHVVVRP